jgi:hypothetical protein
MNRRAWICQGLAVLLLGSLFQILPGTTMAGQKAEWEITTTMEIPGMPFAMPPSVIRQCLESQDVPYHENKDEKCKVVSKDISGDTMTWKVVCDGPEGKTEMTGVSKYTGDTMDTKAQMKSSDGDFSMHMTGKRLGPCK